MDYQLQLNTLGSDSSLVMDEQGNVVALFDWKEGDFTFGLGIKINSFPKYTLQRHAHSKDDVKERIRRIFSGNDLKGQIQ